MVEIDANHPVRTSSYDEVRHELRPDGHPRLIFPVLPSVAEIGDDRRNPGGRSSRRGVDEEKKLENLVSGRRRRLDDKDIPTLAFRSSLAKISPSAKTRIVAESGDFPILSKRKSMNVLTFAVRTLDFG